MYQTSLSHTEEEERSREGGDREKQGEETRSREDGERDTGGRDTLKVVWKREKKGEETRSR